MPKRSLPTSTFIAVFTLALLFAVSAMIVSADSRTLSTRIPPTASCRSLPCVSMTITADTVRTGDSIEATAVPYGTNGRVNEFAPIDWYADPPNAVRINKKDTYGHVVYLVGLTAAARQVVSTRWRVSSTKIYRDTDTVTVYSSTAPPVVDTTGHLSVMLNISTQKCLARSSESPGAAPLFKICSEPFTDSTAMWHVPNVGASGALSSNHGTACLVNNGTDSLTTTLCNGTASQRWSRATEYIFVHPAGKCLSGIATPILFNCIGESWQTWSIAQIDAVSNPGTGGPGPTPDAHPCTAADSVPLSDSHPNEPASMTPLITHAGITIQPCGWFNSVGAISVVQDATKGPVLQLTMSPMTTPGAGTARTDSWPEISTFGATRIYIAFWEKISPNFKGNNGGGGSKNAILHFQATYGGLPNPAIHLPGFLNNIANVDSRIRPVISLINYTAHDGITLSANNVTYYPPDVGETGDPGDLFSRNVWHFIEATYDAPSSGQANGAAKVWVDGTLVSPSGTSTLFVSGLVATQLRTLYDSTQRFTGLELTNVWGGGGTAIAADNWYRYKNVYVSGGFARAGEAPNHWNFTSHDGTTVAPGTTVRLTAQLVDGNGNPVNVCGLQPTLSITNNASWTYWDGAGVYAPLTGCEHGRQLFKVTTSSTGGAAHVVTAKDFQTLLNGQQGAARTGTITITNTGEHDDLSLLTPQRLRSFNARANVFDLTPSRWN